MSKFSAIVLAAGRSTRFGDPDRKKPFATLDGRAVWFHSVDRFVKRSDVVQTMVVVSPDDREEFTRKYGANLLFLGVDLCEGGAERSDSVRAALEKVSEDATHVAIHDAARPLVSDLEIDAVFGAAVESGAAILASPVTATLKRAAGGQIEATVPREALWGAQTPQVFELALFRRAMAEGGDEPVTDDAQLVERLGEPVRIVEGSPRNLKITTPDDLALAAAILAADSGSRSGDQPRQAHSAIDDDDFWA